MALRDLIATDTDRLRQAGIKIDATHIPAPPMWLLGVGLFWVMFCVVVSGIFIFKSSHSRRS